MERASVQLSNAIAVALLLRQYAQTFLPVDQLIAPALPQGELATEPCRLRWVQVASELVAQACVDEALRLVTAKAGAAVASRLI